jgi:hypothetical protein
MKFFSCYAAAQARAFARGGSRSHWGRSQLLLKVPRKHAGISRKQASFEKTAKPRAVSCDFGLREAEPVQTISLCEAVPAAGHDVALRRACALAGRRRGSDEAGPNAPRLAE